MKELENEKFEKYGSFFFLLVLGLGIVLPLVLGLLVGIAGSAPRMDVILPMALIFAFMIWIFLLMTIAWGSLTKPFVKRTAKKVGDLPYHFNSSFTSRAGILYIDLENGMIGFISAYNPQKIQIFNARRVTEPKTVASTMSGVRFVFYLDGKKITMYTLLSNRMVNLKSGMGAEAVSKADAFVELLQAAKSRAEGGMQG
ncbi:MAG: hypothetical protein NC314_05440 [Roseburia sp.]|nr:hypothetical protein [Ruminococcus sp.]MCM1156288.1 hypothetical protein [Roseburia sp.]MCM1242265.1 hypothetical protein [Roseburia sp.]